MDARLNSLLTERFGRDTLLSLATLDHGRPSVRTVNAYYAEGAFYMITWAKSGKMRQIAENPEVGVCGEWFTGHAVAKNLGHVLLMENAGMLGRLRQAFAAWYGNEHVNEADPETILVQLRLKDGVLFHQGERIAFDLTGTGSGG